MQSEVYCAGAGGRNVLVGSNGTLVGWNNSNTGGVPGGFKAADGSGVTTGIEIALPLNLLDGYEGGDIWVEGMAARARKSLPRRSRRSA